MTNLTRRRCWSLVLSSLSWSGAGCGGRAVSLGDRQPPPYRFGTPRALAELDLTISSENPTLTGDLLEIYFNSNRTTGTKGDVWRAHRDSPQAPFGSPVRVDEVSGDDSEVSAAISLDGLSLYVGSDRAGGLGDLDIWRATRAARDEVWSAPEPLAPLNTAGKDIPRQPGQGNLVMPLSSQRGDALAYQIFLAARPSPDRPFTAPALVPELNVADRITVDAFLSEDGLTLFYTSAVVGVPGDLHVAWRKTTADRFSAFAPLDDLNTAGDDRDPWLSPDGTRFYFASDRSGVMQIYEATARRERDP